MRAAPARGGLRGREAARVARAKSVKGRPGAARASAEEERSARWPGRRGAAASQTAGSALNAAKALEVVELELAGAKAELDALISNEDYSGAALQHDEVLRHSLRRRVLELEVEKVARSSIAFSVGHIISHARYGYRGVIFGYTPTCVASEDWILQMGVDKLKHGRNQPFYHVCVDLRDRPGGQTTYVAQENLETHSGTLDARPVYHPMVSKLFASFNADAGTYELGTYLKNQYPNEAGR